MDLQQLLPLLCASKVSKFKQGDLEIEFWAATGEKIADSPAAKPTPSIEPSHAEVPPDLKATDIMSEQQILEWSAPPSADSDPALPLTGDAPISEPIPALEP